MNLRLETSSKKSSIKKRRSGLFLFLLLVAANVSVIMFIYTIQLKSYQSAEVTAKKQISQLQDQLAASEAQNQELQKETERLGKMVKQEAATKAESLRPNQIQLGRTRAGEKVATMTLKTIEPYEKNGRLSTANVQATLAGRVTITGRYNYYDTGPLSSLDGTVVFSDLDESSREKIPQLKGSSSKIYFVFRNQELARELLGPRGTSGYATVTIDNYELNSHPGAVWDKAELVRVLEKL